MGDSGNFRYANLHITNKMREMSGVSVLAKYFPAAALDIVLDQFDMYCHFFIYVIFYKSYTFESNQLNINSLYGVYVY